MARWTPHVLLVGSITLISTAALGAPLHPTSLYVDDNGQLTEIFNNSGLLDGKPLSDYALFINTESIDGSTASFHVLFNDLSQGIYTVDRTNPGHATRIADTNTSVPGGQGNFTEFIGCCGVGSSVSSGTVVFYGEDALSQPGVYASIGGSVSAIATTNTPIPEGVGNFSRFSLPTVDDGGIAFHGGGSSDQLGIYTSINGQLNVVADTSTAVPGGVGNFTDMTSWFSFDDGHVAFQGVDSAGQAGVYSDLTGQLAVVADTDTPIPGGDGNFTDFLPIGNQLSGSAVAFVGYGLNGQAGVYIDEGGVLTVVADTNTPIPDGDGSFTDFGPISLDEGNIVFLGFGLFEQKGYYTTVGGGLRRVADLNTLNFTDFSLLNGPSISGDFILFAAKTPEPASLLMISTGLAVLSALALRRPAKLVPYRQGNGEHRDSA